MLTKRLGKMAPSHRVDTASNGHDADSWVADLKAAGWVEISLNVWRRPDGALFRGPYGAWVALQDRGAGEC